MSDDELRAWDRFAQAGITGYMTGTTIHDEPHIYAKGIAKLAATIADEMMAERIERAESLIAFREAAARISAKIGIGVEEYEARLSAAQAEIVALQCALSEASSNPQNTQITDR